MVVMVMAVTVTNLREQRHTQAARPSDSSLSSVEFVLRF